MKTKEVFKDRSAFASSDEERKESESVHELTFIFDLDKMLSSNLCDVVINSRA